jgi:hypothetical protein
LKFQHDGFCKISLTSSDQTPVDFEDKFSLNNSNTLIGTQKFILYDEYKKFIEGGKFTLQVKISFSSEFLIDIDKEMGMKYKELMPNKSDHEIFIHYKSLYEEGKDFNSQLVTNDNETFSIHKELVSLSCTFFKGLLSGEFKEGNQIKIENVNKITLKSVLNFIYLNEINIGNILEINELSEFSDFICYSELLERLKFQIHSIKLF